MRDILAQDMLVCGLDILIYKLAYGFDKHKENKQKCLLRIQSVEQQGNPFYLYCSSAIKSSAKQPAAQNSKIAFFENDKFSLICSKFSFRKSD